MNSDALERRRVLFLVPSLRRGGAETQVIDLVNALDPSRFEKHLAVLEPRLDQADRIDTKNVVVHRLTRRRKLDLALVDTLAQLMDNHAIEIVHCTLQISLFFAFLARWKTRAKPRLIAAIHTTVNRSRREELFDQVLYRRMLRHCDRVQFVCRAQAEHWTRKYPELRERAVVVYNGVDPAAYDAASAAASGAELRQRLGIDPRRAVIACIAGFRPEKGHEFLLEACRALRGEPWLLLAGDGPERARVEGLIARSGIGDRVALLGEVSDVRPVIAAADVTALASIAVETFSMAMLESMAMAVPVVATDIGGLAEAISPGETGDLVPPGDAAELRSALQRILDDDVGRRAMGVKARDCVRVRFSQRAMADATAKLLFEVLQDARVRRDGRERKD